MPNTASRNQRNNPYLAEDVAVKFHHSMAGLLWRWRTELTLTIAAAWACWRLATLITLTWSLTVLGVAVAAALAVPHSRRYLARHAWCLISRHRLQRVCYETRMHTRAGRLPAICGSTRPRSGNARGSSAGPGSAPRTSTPTRPRSPLPATPAKRGCSAARNGPSSSASTSCGTTRSAPPVSFRR